MTQGWIPRPRTQKSPRPKTDFLRTGFLEAKDRNAQGQGHKAQEKDLRAKKSQLLQNSGILKKKGFHKFYAGSQAFFYTKKKSHDLGPFLTNQKIVLSSTEDRAFRGLEGYEAKDLTFEIKAKDFKMCPQGLHLCC